MWNIILFLRCWWLSCSCSLCILLLRCWWMSCSCSWCVLFWRCWWWCCGFMLMFWRTGYLQWWRCYCWIDVCVNNINFLGTKMVGIVEPNHTMQLLLFTIATVKLFQWVANRLRRYFQNQGTPVLGRVIRAGQNNHNPNSYRLQSVVTALPPLLKTLSWYYHYSPELWQWTCVVTAVRICSSLYRALQTSKHSKITRCKCSFWILCLRRST